MPRLLVADDEMRIRELIKKYAKFEGYEVEEAADGLETLNKFGSGEYDLVILDVMMPELDGFSVCREIRRKNPTPVIMLSARGEEYDKIHGFELGVDDYVVKPFSPRELMMRVAAVLKRTGVERTQKELYEKNGLRVDFTSRQVWLDGQELSLSPKEYDLLFYLVRHRGVALSRERLLNQVWGYDFYGDDRTLDTHIKLLRRTLGRLSGNIVTLRGVGYRFDE